MALAWLAVQRGGPVTVEEIARGAGVPRAYLGKAIHQLARRGIVSTQRGVGVALTIDPASFTLYDLCVALDDPILVPRCALGVAECSDERGCPAHEFAKATREREFVFLRGTTIADLVAFEIKRNPSWSENRPGASVG